MMINDFSLKTDSSAKKVCISAQDVAVATPPKSVVLGARIALWLSPSPSVRFTREDRASALLTEMGFQACFKPISKSESVGLAPHDIAEAQKRLFGHTLSRPSAP